MDTGLFFTLTTETDGSGQQNLFMDAARTHSAGRYVWTAPQWKDGMPDAYPVLIHEDFQITDGSFSGDKGTADSTLDDATGNNGKIHLSFADGKGESAICDLIIENGMARADNMITLQDNTRCRETDVPEPNGDMQCTFVFPDGSQEVELMAPENGH